MAFIADTPIYNPFMLRGRLNWHQTQAEDYQHGIYRLVAVRDGIHTVQTRSIRTEVKPGGIYLITPGEWESVSATPGSTSFLIAFTVTVCALKPGEGPGWDLVDWQDQQPKPDEVWGVSVPLRMDDALCPMLASQIQLICSIWWRDRWHQYTANTRLALMLEKIITHYRESQIKQVESIAYQDWIGSVYEMIEQRLVTIQTTSDLAAAFGMERGQFTKKFKEATGVTPAVFLKQRRLDEAALLLRSTSWPIHEIASHLGYPSRGAFHQAWRKSYVVSPGQWRNG